MNQSGFMYPTLPFTRTRTARFTVRAISRKVSDIRHYPAGTDKVGARKIRADEKRQARREALERRHTPHGYLDRPGAGIHPYGSRERTDAEREARAKLVAGKPGTSEALFRYTEMLSGGECDMLIDRLRTLWLERLDILGMGRPIRLTKDVRFLHGKLIEEIKLCDELYYADEPKPRISDQEYDELVLHLLELERCFPELIRDDSPSNTVGHGAAVRATKLALENEISAEAVDAQDSFYATVPTSTKLFPQRRHRALMLSLDNAYTYSDLTAFMNRASTAKSKIAVELKIDGVALSLEYRNGHLCHALTRGTGRIGDDVTENVREALLGRGVVECIPDAAVPDMVVIRGEVYISKAEFNEVNASLDRALSNPRNAAAGALKHKNPAEAKARRLRFIAYECLTGALDEGGTRDENGVSAIVPDLHNAWPTHAETLVSLAAWGFGEMPMRKTCSGITEAEEFALRVEEDRSLLAMEVDGVVLKLDDARAREAAGHTARAPRGAIAYKFAAQSKVTQLKDVVMQVSRAGLITPVAILEPVKIGGALLSRATLHNFDEVKRLGVAVGDCVRVERGGDVIPKVLNVEKKGEEAERSEITPPTNCPSCGSELKHGRAPRTGAHLIGCTNNVNCSSQTLGRLIHFCGREAMDIRGLGKKTAEKLTESGVVVVPVDVFRLTLDDILNLEGFAEKSASQLYENIQEAASTRSLERVLFGVGLPGVGRTGARALAAKLGSLQTLFEIATKENGLETLMGITNFAERTAQGLLEFLKKDRTLRELKALAELVTPSTIVDEADVGELGAIAVAAVAERNFVFTGKFVKLSRPEVMKWIRRSGGFIKSSVTRKTDYVVYGLDPGQKLFKAQRSKVQTVPEEEFLSLFEVSPEEQQKLTVEVNKDSDD
ncbi:DNA ligase [Gracilariopsis chorda]|uniref:DNA ligase (NAD(+)) n=1 Tax=Gracilariopsis chorda TaxID=448386 RepID=A0A2V3ITT3_9FLOR|nr:DNA ligase [Gracilariopsis chorda]|eukprot:PXF45137.1 DNA ligase [Gracilariopsis chorda]